MTKGNVVIVDEYHGGLFLRNMTSGGDLGWSEEYPDAHLFECFEQAITYLECEYPGDDHECLQIVENYGMADERRS